MFTGIVEAIGEVLEAKPQKDIFLLRIKAPASFRKIQKGGSVSVNGACLTVVQKTGAALSFHMIPETARRTTLGALRKGGRVNLERALLAQGRFEGHFVLGHVDGVGKILRVSGGSREKSFFVSCPQPIARYLVEKGSVAVDGVSLTIGKVSRRGFWVHCIPHTLSTTLCGGYRLETRVNLEADVLMKLVSKLVKDN